MPTNTQSRPEGALALWWRTQAVDSAHPYLADGILALALGAASVVWASGHATAMGASLGFSAGMAAPLAFRRVWPVEVFAVASAVALAQWFATGPLPADASLLAMLFTLTVERSRRTALLAAAILEAGVVMASFHWALGDSWEASLVGLSGLLAAALLAGAVLRARRAYFSALTEKAAQLELERDQQAQIAAAAERARIAREMHDVIAHSLAVMVTMADGAAAKLKRDPASAREAVEAIAETGRQALGDTRRLIGVLRQDDASPSRAPAPGLAELDELVGQLRSTGLDARLELVGEQFELAPGAALTVYRLVQEAATNTLKHASGARTFVARVLFDRPSVRVEVRDDGAGTPLASPAGGARTAPGRTGDGHGLAGMRERAALYGGTVHAGPAPTGGWLVSASLSSAGLPGQLVHGRK